MKTYAELRQHFYHMLSPVYLQGELQTLYHWCVEELDGWSRVEAYLHNEETVSEEHLDKWQRVIDRLLGKEPVQYIFNKAQFMDFDLFVDESVLIPRPETEELVQLVLSNEKSIDLSVLDIGTGSGCIPIALKIARPYWKIKACDVSEEALSIAQKNASAHKVPIEFLLRDVRDEMDWEAVDVIVSNPPYIPSELKNTIEDNVLKYEPAIALFAPAEEPFYYYQRITKLAAENDVSAIYFETHATEIGELIESLKPYWKGSINKVLDMQGKERFLILSKKKRA